MKTKKEKKEMKIKAKWKHSIKQTVGVIMQVCFDNMDWEIFYMAADNIDEYAEPIFRKCINDVVLYYQKPWINCAFHMTLAELYCCNTSTTYSARQLSQRNAIMRTEWKLAKNFIRSALPDSMDPL